MATTGARMRARTTRAPAATSTNGNVNGSSSNTNGSSNNTSAVLPLRHPRIRKRRRRGKNSKRCGWRAIVSQEQRLQWGAAVGGGCLLIALAGWLMMLESSHDRLDRSWRRENNGSGHNGHNNNGNKNGRDKRGRLDRRQKPDYEGHDSISITSSGNDLDFSSQRKRDADRALQRSAVVRLGGRGGGVLASGWRGYADRLQENDGGIFSTNDNDQYSDNDNDHAMNELDRRFRQTHEGGDGIGTSRGMGTSDVHDRIQRRRNQLQANLAQDNDDRYHLPHGSLHLPTPVLVVGMPKSGTTSIHAYFKCGGQLASHFACNNHYTVNATTEGRPLEVVEAEDWRNCRMPPGAGDADWSAEEDIDGNEHDEEGSNEHREGRSTTSTPKRRKKSNLNIDAGDFPLCSVCVERNIQHDRPPLEGCGTYDVWAELDSAEHPLPSLLARDDEMQWEKREDGAREKRERMAAAAAAAAARERSGERGLLGWLMGWTTTRGQDVSSAQLEQTKHTTSSNSEKEDGPVLEFGATARPLCSYPQITHLEEIHKAYPNSTFILNLRPVEHWIASISKWNGNKRRTKTGYLREVLTLCDLPGFASGVGKTDDELKDFYNSHSQRIRDFVKKHPSHALVEVDIEKEDAGIVLEEAFGVSHHCWKVRNASPEKRGDPDGQYVRAAYLGGAQVLGEKNRKSKGKAQRRDRAGSTSTTVAHSAGLRFRPNRDKQSTDATPDEVGDDDRKDGGSTKRYSSREERDRIMLQKAKKNGALDAWRDRRNYPVCDESIYDIFPHSNAMQKRDSST